MSDGELPAYGACRHGEHGYAGIEDVLQQSAHCYIRQYGEDMPEIRDWKWGARETGKTGPARK